MKGITLLLVAVGTLAGIVAFSVPASLHADDSGVWAAGQYTGTVVVNGTTFNYSAYKLPRGTINVGRITPPR